MKVAEMGEKIKGQKQRLIEKFTAETRVESAITLADSVIHRRAVLDVLNQLLGSDDNDKFHKEEAVHSIIFPLRKTSDDMPPDLSNLWVIDERLAFHHYLASDKRIDQLDPIQSESGREPDIIVFHHAFAAAEDPECPQTITIIEFKRPGRDDYSFDENPYLQIKRYVELILDSKVKDRTGRIFAVPPETRFYGYIVADLTPKLTGLLRRNGFEYGTEMGSMFATEPNLRLSIHAIDYKQLVKDATRRNRSFFLALGLH